MTDLYRFGVARWMGTDHQRVIAWYKSDRAAKRAAGRLQRQLKAEGRWLGTIGVVQI